MFDAAARHVSGILSMEGFRRVIGEVHPAMHSSSPAASGEVSLADIFGHFPNISEVENFMIIEAMKLTKGNQGMAASLLGMTRQPLIIA